MPKKKTSFEKHIQGKKFNKEMKIFFQTQKKKTRKMHRKMKYLLSIVHTKKSERVKRSLLKKYLKVQSGYNDACTYVQSQRLYDTMNTKVNE